MKLMASITSDVLCNTDLVIQNVKLWQQQQMSKAYNITAD